MAVIRNRAAEADLTFRAGKLDTSVLRVVRVDGEEALSRLFRFRLELASADPEIDFAKVLGQKATLTIHGNPQPRHIHGIVCSFVQAGRGTDFTRYRAELVPAVWLLTQRRNSRIFQEMKVDEIVKKVLHDGGVPSSAYRLDLHGTYKARDYCVQYEENDWAFISRLLEEEGIFFFFDHQEDAHTVVIGDTPSSYPKIVDPSTLTVRDPGFAVTDKEFITTFECGREICPGAVVLQDFDPAHPNLDLTVQAEGERRDLQLYDYPGGYQEKGHGNDLAKVRLEEANAPGERVVATSDCRRLLPGHTFTLAEHERGDFNRDYLVTQVHHRGSQPQSLSPEAAAAQGGEPVYENDLTCIPAATPFRPPRITPRPRIAGAQTAMVVGPKGEEVHTDSQGRVKVQFHWDREGQVDDKSSCWVRCSHGWAGGGYGIFFLPRIGQEVVVDFLDGDPDRPLVTGHVYNGSQVPPLNLPAEKTRSTIKTRTSKGGGGSNEITFEDKKGEEDLLFHATKDQDVRVANDRREHIGNDRHLVVVRDKVQKVERDEHSLVDRDQITEVTRDHSLKVGKNQSIEVVGNRSLTVKGDVIEAYKANHSQEVGSDLYLKAMGVVIEGMKELTVKVGGSFLKIDSGGVTISGPQIKLNSGGSAGSGKIGKAVAAAAPLAAAIAASVVLPKDPLLRKAAAAPTHKDPKEEEVAEKKWIEIELVDEADEPVAGESYLVTLPDGSVATGRTGPDGVARIEGVEPGSCKICFPKLDQDAWEKI